MNNPVYYGHRFPDDLEALDAGVIPMDLVSPYPPEFYRPNPPLTRIMGADWGLPRIIRRCYSDVLPMMLDLRAAGAPLDFCTRVHDNLDRWDDALAEDEAIERSNLGEHGMAQVPDPTEGGY